MELLTSVVKFVTVCSNFLGIIKHIDRTRSSWLKSLINKTHKP